MNNSTNPVKTLVQRFVSLEPGVRMRVTKKLLELYGSDQAAREAKVSPDSGSPLIRKSFLEQFWDEVEMAHGADARQVNPFTQQRRAKARDSDDGEPEIDRQEGFLHWCSRPTDLFALL